MNTDKVTNDVILFFCKMKYYNNNDNDDENRKYGGIYEIVPKRHVANDVVYRCCAQRSHSFRHKFPTERPNVFDNTGR